MPFVVLAVVGAEAGARAGAAVAVAVVLVVVVVSSVLVLAAAAVVVGAATAAVVVVAAVAVAVLVVVVVMTLFLTFRALKAGRSSIQDAKASDAEVAPEARARGYDPFALHFRAISRSVAYQTDKQQPRPDFGAQGYV